MLEIERQKKTQLGLGEVDARNQAKLYFGSVNGYKSKSESIKQLILENNIDIIFLAEKKVYSKKAIKIEGIFRCYT